MTGTEISLSLWATRTSLLCLCLTMLLKRPVCMRAPVENVDLPSCGEKYTGDKIMKVDGCDGRETTWTPMPSKADLLPSPNVHLIFLLISLMKCSGLVATWQFAPPLRRDLVRTIPCGWFRQRLSSLPADHKVQAHQIQDHWRNHIRDCGGFHDRSEH